MSDKNKKIIICAGGTGGHVFPAKRLSEMLLKEGAEIRWIGSSRGPEEQICKDLGIKFYRYPLTGFRGKSLFFKILSFNFLILKIFSRISDF
jgi:UDP-N-acetylglucosamine--N-acetylmuramyl-(pentapeptide) pyrophosphoryl-undecaprenol N-acetylglucosamine transferase